MNRSTNCNDMMPAKTETKYPSLDEVEDIPLPSFGDAFQISEQDQPSRFRGGSSSVMRQHDIPRTSQRSTSSTGSIGRHREKSESSGAYPVSNASSDQKRPSLHRLKSSDLLDTKPSALTRPAARPGVVEVNHAPYGTRHEHLDTYQYGQPSLHSGASSQRSTQMTQQQHHHSRRAPRPFPRMELEVMPGVFLPLHGSEETYHALREDRLCATYCLACETPLFCVEYAAQVLCPNCRVVSPVFTHEERRGRRGSGGHGAPLQEDCGVGLGMTVDEYDRVWAEEEERRAIYYGHTGDSYHPRY